MPRKRKRKRTRITPEILERMVDLRKRGLIYKEIAEKLGIALQTVAIHMHKEGLGGRRRKVTGEVMERMRDLEKEGVSKKEIADKLNLSYGTVLRYLKREELGLVGEKEEKVVEEKEGKAGLVGRLKRALGRSTER